MKRFLVLFLFVEKLFLIELTLLLSLTDPPLRIMHFNIELFSVTSYRLVPWIKW